MQRTVTTPADLSGDALDDLKGWLGISRSQEDGQLTDLLGASLAMCEAFTGQMPIEQTVEEWVPNTRGEHSIATRPVRSFLSAERIAHDGTRSTLDAAAYEFRIDASQAACLSLDEDFEGQAIAVAFRAGLASEWSAVPQALKQGIIRLAAFHYRDRETGRDAIPPASVTALWRPWRIVRLT